MKRRDFLNTSAKLAAAPLMLNAIPVGVFQPADLLQAVGCDTVRDRVLVIIQMRGGNDGINTVIPIEQYDTYSNLRPDIRIKETDYILLDSGLDLPDQVALHPSMTAIKNLYDSGYVNLIQGTGYENHNRSHFKSTDLYLTGGDSTPDLFNLEEGWMGRYLSYTFEQVIAHPQSIMQDPVGLQFGNKKPSLGFHTLEQHAAAISLSGQDPAGFFTLISEVGQQAPVNIPNSDYGDKLDYILGVESDTNTYARRISDVFNAGKNSSTTYPNTYLANQLKTVARLMNGGSKTKVYLVDMTGFDNHVNQVDATNSSIGNHANLLNQLSEGVKAFMDDLEAMGYDDRVAMVTFSEFGRTADQNANNGTDHGTISPMFVFGKHINAGVTGTNVDLSNIISRAPTGFQNDYRSVFTGLLRDWLGASDSAMMATGFLPWMPAALSLVTIDQVADPTCSPLPDEHPSIVYSDADDTHTFSVTIPLPDTSGGVSNIPVTELTDCEYVVLADGFNALEGVNLRIFPSVCVAPPIAALLVDSDDPYESTIAMKGTPPESHDDPKLEFEWTMNQAENFSDVEAFPNPFHSRVTVSFKPEPDEKDINVEIVDNNGRTIRIPIIHSFYNSDYFSLVFDGSGLTPGIYYAAFSSEKRQKTMKIIKQ